MKLVIKDRYNVVVNDYARKVVVSKNLCFGGLNSEYPNATTPLSDTDKLLIQQSGEWKQVDKSEIGGGGGVTKHSELTLDDGTNPHGTNRADMGIIEVDNTPTTWQPNAIYFVRNTGQIWQTDENGVPFYFPKRKKTIFFGGKWSTKAGTKYAIPQVTYGPNHVGLTAYDINGRSSPELIAHPYMVGKFIGISGLKLTRILLSSRFVSYGDPLTFVIGRKTPGNNVSSTVPTTDAEVITKFPFIPNAGKQYFNVFEINSNVVTKETDMITFHIEGYDIQNNQNLENAVLGLIFK